jgi:hypothetical protein
MNGGEWAFLKKTTIPIPIPIHHFFMSELRLQFPFPFVSCNSGNQLTEWGQLLIKAKDRQKRAYTRC